MWKCCMQEIFKKERKLFQARLNSADYKQCECCVENTSGLQQHKLKTVNKYDTTTNLI